MKKIVKVAKPALAQPMTAALLGQAIKAKRTQSGLRLEDAAALCGVAKQTFMKIEHGQSTCQLKSILQVCTALGIKLYIEDWQTKEEASDDWQ